MIPGTLIAMDLLSGESKLAGDYLPRDFSKKLPLFDNASVGSIVAFTKPSSHILTTSKLATFHETEGAEMPPAPPILSPRLSPLASLSPLSLSPRLSRRRAADDNRGKRSARNNPHAELTLSKVSQHTLSHYQARDRDKRHSTAHHHTSQRNFHDLGGSELDEEEEDFGGAPPGMESPPPPGLIDNVAAGPPGLVKRKSEESLRGVSKGSLSSDWADQTFVQSEGVGEGGAVVLMNRMNKQAEMLRLAGANCPSLSGLKGKRHRSFEKLPVPEQLSLGDMGEEVLVGVGEGEEGEEEGQNGGFESSLEGAQKFDFEECAFELGDSLGDLAPETGGLGGKNHEEKKRQLLQVSAVGELKRVRKKEGWTPSERWTGGRRRFPRLTDTDAFNIGGPRLGLDSSWSEEGEGERGQGGAGFAGSEEAGPVV